MAVIKAAASGNWSATATWSGGVVPSLNDTVYANGFTVTLDQSINLTGSTVDTSGSFIPGQIYQIVSLGTTAFNNTANCIAVGSNAGTAVAVASTVGTYFQAVNAGTATTGTARRVGALLTFVNTPLTIATGGGFALTANYDITGAFIMAGSTAALSVSGTASTTLTGCRAVGSAFTGATRSILFSSSGTLSGVGSTIAGGNASGAYGLGNTGAGTVNLTASSEVRGGTFNSDSWGISNSSTGIIQMTSGTIVPGLVAGGIRNTSTGQVICSGVAAISGYLEAIRNEGNGSVTFSNGSVTGGNTGGITNSGMSGSVTVNSSTIAGGTNDANSHGIRNTTGGLITTTGCTITGAATGGGYGIHNASTGSLVLNSSTINANALAGVFNASTGSITSSGDITATNTAHGISSTNASAVVIVSGSLISAANGTVAVYSPKFRMSPAPLVAKTRYALNGTSTFVDMFTADNTSGILGVATTDVRSGVSYGGGLVGTCAVPSASSVASGVPVGSTTGTAVLTAAAIRTELAVELARIDAAVSSAGNAPTVAQIRQEMDSNSTKLANLDATVSSRLATSGYTAAPTTAQIATAVEGSLLNEADGQTVLNAIVGAIGNTNLSEVSIVAAVRADLERVGGKIDSIPTTAAPTAAANATAVWSAATKEITGGTVTTLTNSPSVPSAASIAAATRSELAVELARVDAAVSTRLAGSAYTAPANSDITAIKAKTDLLNTDRLANVATTAIVGNLIAQANS